MFSFGARLPCSCCHCWTELISLLLLSLKGRKAGAIAQKVMAFPARHQVGFAQLLRVLLAVPRYQMEIFLNALITSGFPKLVKGPTAQMEMHGLLLLWFW